MEVLLLIGGLAFGGGLGYFTGKKLEQKIYAEQSKPVGTLHVETSDPDGPYLFLELSTDVSNVSNKEKVTLDVDTKSYISQE